MTKKISGAHSEISFGRMKFWVSFFVGVGGGMNLPTHFCPSFSLEGKFSPKKIWGECKCLQYPLPLWCVYIQLSLDRFFLLCRYIPLAGLADPDGKYQDLDPTFLTYPDRQKRNTEKGLILEGSII